jgi:hypothetical protein
LGCLDGRILAIDIYGITYGIKNADGILPGGSDMVNVQKNLSLDHRLVSINKPTASCDLGSS